MPAYDYKCKKCEHVFEFSHSIADNPVVKCPECGGIAGKTISSNVGIAFRGSGFYANDSRKSAEKTAAPAKVEKKPDAPACGACCPGCKNSPPGRERGVEAG